MKSGVFTALVLGTALAAHPLEGQHTHGQHTGQNPDTSDFVGVADAAMSGPMSAAAKKHMLLSPVRKATPEDSARAREIARRLRASLAQYADTSAAVAAGYRMFMPNVKQQRVFHFTNARHAVMEAVRFDPEKPTSILYQRAGDGSLKLVGAMYTAPKRMRVSRLDDRVPLSIARWHKHVNWCVPRMGEGQRWLERTDSLPVFGPHSPIATKRECEAVGGRFHPSVLGWMIHANVFLGEDLETVFGHDH